LDSNAQRVRGKIKPYPSTAASTADTKHYEPPRATAAPKTESRALGEIRTRSARDPRQLGCRRRPPDRVVPGLPPPGLPPRSAYDHVDDGRDVAEGAARSAVDA
jgi:hypothetical protein